MAVLSYQLKLFGIEDIRTAISSEKQHSAWDSMPNGALSDDEVECRNRR